MKKWFICAALFAGAAMQAAPESVDVKICSYQVVNDTVVNALSPMGLALTPNGDILAGFQDRGDIMPQCKSYIVRSSDGGKTWSAPEKVFKGSNDKIGVALTLHNAPDGSIFMTKTTVTHTGTTRQAVFRKRTSVIETFRSVDGKEFTPVQTLATPEESLFTITAKITELPNGDWVLPGYGSARGRVVPGEVYGSGFFRSTDKGKTWGKFERAFIDDPAPGEKPYRFNEIDMLVKKDGTLVAFARIDSRPRCHLWKTESKDNGKTWSKPVETKVPGLYPAIIKLDNGGYFMVAGNRYTRPIIRTVNFFYSPDGDEFTYVGMPYYTRTGGKPYNSATGGMQAVIKDPASGRYIVTFYSFDPTLHGTGKCYVDSNILEIK